MSTSGSQGRPPIRIGVIGATPSRGWGTAAHLPALKIPLALADDAALVSRPEVDAVAITGRSCR